MQCTIDVYVGSDKILAKTRNLPNSTKYNSSPKFVDLQYNFKWCAVLPRLDTLHVLDASAHFDAGWSGRNTF